MQTNFEIVFIKHLKSDDAPFKNADVAFKKNIILISTNIKRGNIFTKLLKFSKGGTFSPKFQKFKKADHSHLMTIIFREVTFLFQISDTSKEAPFSRNFQKFQKFEGETILFEYLKSADIIFKNTDSVIQKVLTQIPKMLTWILKEC